MKLKTAVKAGQNIVGVGAVSIGNNSTQNGNVGILVVDS
jgi:hypothetical protein